MAGKKGETTKGENQRNEGEGNRTAARQYNEAQQSFVRSGKVDEKTREGAEGKALRDAELVGKRHIAEEDPEVKG